MAKDKKKDSFKDEFKELLGDVLQAVRAAKDEALEARVKRLVERMNRLEDRLEKLENDSTADKQPPIESEPAPGFDPWKPLSPNIPTVPLGPWPTTPWDGWKAWSTCDVCGIDCSNGMGYCCTRTDCPIRASTYTTRVTLETDTRTPVKIGDMTYGTTSKLNVVSNNGCQINLPEVSCPCGANASCKCGS